MLTYSKKRVLTITLLALLSLSSLSSPLDFIMKEQLTNTRPELNEKNLEDLFDSRPIGGNTRQYQNVKLENLEKLTKISQYRHFAVLAHGTKYEMYANKENVNTGSPSYSMINSLLGVKSGDSFELLGVNGRSNAQAKQMFDEVKYQVCKKYLIFIERCTWKTRKVPRNYSKDEIKAIGETLRHFSHNIAISSLKLQEVQLDSGIEIEAESDGDIEIKDLIPKSQILYGVGKENVVKSVEMMIEAQIEEGKREEIEKVLSGDGNGKVGINSKQMWKVEFVKDGEEFKIVVNC